MDPKIFHKNAKIAKRAIYIFGSTYKGVNYQIKRQLVNSAIETTKAKFIWKYFIREFIVSLFASLNFFVTLGFAGVSLEGKLKYFAIIEGMLGWLILVILSAALVNSFIMI